MSVTEPAAATAALRARLAEGDQRYARLVWRRFRRSFMGMVGLVLVSTLLLMALFADFFAPMNPHRNTIAFAPPDDISFFAPDGSFSLIPYVYPIVETGEFDPVTFQPLVGPDYENPREIVFFAPGYSYRLPGLIPMDRHLFGAADGSTLSPPGHRQARPGHPLARHPRIAHLAHLALVSMTSSPRSERW
jgi:peptide/nickel transport system permease protein